MQVEDRNGWRLRPSGSPLHPVHVVSTWGNMHVRALVVVQLSNDFDSLGISTYIYWSNPFYLIIGEKFKKNENFTIIPSNNII
jgi:hypothetical protein